MKISFSTLGCPEWSWDDMVVTAKDLGFNGIEVRGVENEMHVPRAKPFTDKNIDETKGRLSKLGLEIPCLTSSCFLFDKNENKRHMREAEEYIVLAQKLGTPFVRVLGDSAPEPGDSVDLDFVAENLKSLAVFAEDKGVRVLIETNGQLADSRTMLMLLEKVNHPNAAVLWDVHHPFRFMGEQVEETYEALRDHIAFVHLKDSVMLEGKVRYKMMGRGDIGVRKAVQLLAQNRYEGFVSLEWVRRWNMELEAPGIVFPHFVNFIRELF